ncbi:GNAT family N-acetyltransferase [Bradyrhizobium japonicum]
MAAPAPGEMIGIGHHGLAMRLTETGTSRSSGICSRRRAPRASRSPDWLRQRSNSLLEQQFRAQSAGYAAQFPDAVSLLIVRRDEPIGRLILHCTAQRWHIVDIVLLPAERGHGLGTEVIDALEASARQQGVGALTLSVLGGNPAAHGFYLRRGFAETGQAGAAHIAMKKDLA